MENRTAGTAYRGSIAIHASQSDQPLRQLAKLWPSGSLLHPEPFDGGELIGVAKLVAVVPSSHQLECDPSVRGPLCWLLEVGRQFDEPIPLKGKLNLFKLPGEAAANIVARLQQPARTVDEQSLRDFARAMQPNEIDQLVL